MKNDRHEDEEQPLRRDEEHRDLGLLGLAQLADLAAHVELALALLGEELDKGEHGVGIRNGTFNY